MVAKIYLTISELIGTIIGAGFLAIPYVIMKSGASIGLLHLLIIGLMITFTMLCLGEVALRTKQNHQLTGYAEKYLGKWGKRIMFVSVIFGVYSAVLAYLIAEGVSISQLIFSSTEHAFMISVIFWIVLSCFVFFGIKALKEGEFLGNLIIILIVFLITIFFTSKIDIDNLTTISLINAWAPFGVILFAYQAYTAVTEAKIILGKEKRKMKSAIIYAHILAFVVYAIFAIVVLGYKGMGTPEIATLSLGKPFIFLGIFTMLTSYLSLSVSLMDNLMFDYKIRKMKAWFFTISVPILLYIAFYLINKTSFTLVLGVGGVISGGVMAILILLMHKKAKTLGDRKPEYEIPYSNILAIILSVIFITGAVIEIIHAIK